MMSLSTKGQSAGRFAGKDDVDRQSKECPDYCKTYTFRDANGSLKQFVFPKALDLDRPKRARTTFSSQQLELLESEFKTNQYLVGKERTDLARRLGLSETQVKVWFQNRRTKFKKDKDKQSKKTDSVAESLATKNVLRLLEYKTPPSIHQPNPNPNPSLRQVQSPSTKDSHVCVHARKLTSWEHTNGTMSRRESQDSMTSHYNYCSSMQSYPYHCHQPSNSLSPHMSLFHKCTVESRSSLTSHGNFESNFDRGKPSRCGFAPLQSNVPRLPLYQHHLADFPFQVLRY